MFKHRIANRREGLVENADTAFRAMVSYEPWQLKMEPAMKNAALMAQLSGNQEIIGYTRDWINVAVRGMPTKFELGTEKYFDWVGRNILEKGTKWLPARYRFQTKDRAAKQILSGWRRATLSGAMGFRLKPSIRNSGQTLLSTAVVGARHSDWSFRSLFTEGGKELLEHSTTRLGRFALQSFDVTNLGNYEKYGLASFKAIDKWPNVAKTFNESLHFLITRDKTKVAKLQKYGFFEPWSNINRSSKTLNKAILAGEFRKDVGIANYMTKLSQYSYKNFDMPRILWGQWGKTLGQFTSWPLNYYYSYLPEVAKYTLSGRGPGGIRLTGWERTALFRHYTYQTGIWAVGKSMGIDLSKHLPPRPKTTFPFINLGGAAPQRLSPAAQFGEGMATLLFSGDDKRMETEGSSKMWRSITFAPPLAIRDTLDVISGDKEAIELFFTLPKDDRASRRRRGPRPPGMARPRLP